MQLGRLQAASQARRWRPVLPVQQSVVGYFFGWVGVTLVVNSINSIWVGVAGTLGVPDLIAFCCQMYLEKEKLQYRNVGFVVKSDWENSDILSEKYTQGHPIIAIRPFHKI